MRFSLKTKISTSKINETRAFYESVFDMRVVEEWDSHDDNGVILSFENGKDEAYLEIYDTSKTHDFAGLSLQFKVDDVKAFARKLPDNLDYEGPKSRPWGSTYLYLEDPAGVLVIVYEGRL